MPRPECSPIDKESRKEYIVTNLELTAGTIFRTENKFCISKKVTRIFASYFLRLYVG